MRNTVDSPALRHDRRRRATESKGEGIFLEHYDARADCPIINPTFSNHLELHGLRLYDRYARYAELRIARVRSANPHSILDTLHHLFPERHWVRI